MVQREVGERLAAGPGDEQYGAVSVKVAYYAEASLVGVVPPTVFVPRPKVESVLVADGAATVARRSTCRRRDALFALVRAGFAQRRKMLRRSLAPVLGARTTTVLDAAGVAPTARGRDARARGVGRGAHVGCAAVAAQRRERCVSRST